MLFYNIVINMESVGKKNYLMYKKIFYANERKETGKQFFSCTRYVYVPKKELTR